MTFTQNSLSFAAREMDALNPGLTHQFVSVIKFLIYSPQSSKKPSGGYAAPELGSENHIRQLAGSFLNSRQFRSPVAPQTIPDQMVSVILNEYFNVEENELIRISREHALSMGAENFVGELLERYLASVLESMGWIWCSGSIVRAADFIKYDNGIWHVLQVKNRDNSENSSSSAIRIGTDIKKWFRTFSRKAGSNWEAFPDNIAKKHLSEEKFTRFTRMHLTHLKTL